MKEKELILLRHLRSNARKSLAKISKETKIPVSTLFDTLKKLENSVIKKHTSLIDFSKLGYSFKVIFSIATRQKKEMRAWLLQHPNINTLSSSINDYDFHFECLFKDLKEHVDFKESLEKFHITRLDETFVVDELKKEGFVYE